MKIIDIHTHGISGFDTSTHFAEHILKIAEIQGRQGVSEIILTVYPSSLDTMRDHLNTIKKAMEIQRSETGSRMAGMYQGEKTPAKIIGAHCEGPFLNAGRCGALDARSFIEPNEYNLNSLIDGFADIIKIMTIAPELEGALQIIKYISDQGIIASMGHSDSTCARAEAGFQAGARGITHIFNAMRGIHHREPGLAGFGLMNTEVYIEVIADPYHLDHRLIEFIFSAKNPERIIIVSDTVKTSAMTPESTGVRNKNSTLLGGSMTIRESSDRLIQRGLGKESVLRAISDNPERYLKEC